MKKRLNGWPIVFIGPHMLLFFLFFLVPAVIGIYVSFTEWDLFSTPIFVGFDNFPLANVVYPSLTFAEQPTDAMGKDAGKLLYERIKGNYSNYPKTIVHKPVIYYKDSIRCI